ncbi:MAG: hypothetical protein HY959_07800 [Ignavibacteriae bacterium]|nr:hypothetical protein [Ignavibacteriota bacterium]
MVTVKKELIIDDDMNFAAEVSSVFHMLCALSFANKLSKERYVKGTIFIRNHFIKNDPISEQVLEFENLRLEFVSFRDKYRHLEFTSKSEGKKDKNNNVIYLLSVKVPNLDMYLKYRSNTNKKIQAIVIDEGTGTYYNFSGIFYPLKTFLKKLLICMNLSTVKKYFFLKRKGNKIFPDREVVSDLVEVIDKYNKARSVPELDILKAPGRKYAVLISGLFIEMGLISQEEYKKHLYEIKNILESYGVSLLIKPYQSEDLEKYNDFNFDILPWDAPCECVFPILKPVMTIGFLSTSMVTGKVLYDIDTIDVGDIFGLKNDIPFESRYNKVYELFGEYISRADSPGKFEECVKNIARKKNLA